MPSSEQAEQAAGGDSPLAEALAHLERRDYQAALMASGKAVEAERESAEVWTCMAAALSGLRRISAAEEACRRALQIDPGYPRAIANLGAVLGSQEHWEEAREHLERATALGERTWECLSALALTRLKTEKF